MDKKQKLFYLLEKILAREELSENILPSNLEQWQSFLNRINNSFYNFEQERYLLERSMEISSREMIELNERIETAQKIAHMGYWFHNPKANQILWSKETYRLFGLDPSLPVPNFEGFIEMVHEEDRPSLLRLIERAYNKGQDYEIEMRIINVKDNQIVWVYVKGHPYKKDKTQSDYLLSGIVMDITERKNAEEDLVQINQQLILLSRQAGMSEVATSVLHNIGNILNSLNISLVMIKEAVNKNNINYLSKISQMINENVTNPDYLLSDPKGKLIPKYLSIYSENLFENFNEINKEMDNLTKNISHINDIVAMQKDISGISGVKERVYLPEICDLAIQMGCASQIKHNIKLIKNYKFGDPIIIDKTKLLQILVNLISNAKDALNALENQEQKILTVSIKKTDSGSNIAISVEDNGIGILKNDLIKIFSMGFTTKTSGHGFGLHSCALAANELEGTLTAESKGKGKGAIFTLKLPLNKNSHDYNNKNHDEHSK